LGFTGTCTSTPKERGAADRVRERLARRFIVELGRWHDRPVGPHPKPMYQVKFAPDQFGALVPWLMLNREGLSILVDPTTGDDVAAHDEWPLWLGEPLPIDDAFLRQVASRA
jgi:aromatic ring-cleaving dioxygenase